MRLLLLLPSWFTLAVAVGFIISSQQNGRHQGVQAFVGPVSAAAASNRQHMPLGVTRDASSPLASGGSSNDKGRAWHDSQSSAPAVVAAKQSPLRGLPVAITSDLRRRWAGTAAGCLVVGSALLASLPPDASAASSPSERSPFFQKADRPMLTSSLLEQYRIWDQEVADNLKYGGELERGDAANKGRVDAYPELLVPIVRMQTDLQRVEELVSSKAAGAAAGPDEWRQVQLIVSQPQYEAKQFKTVFNAYGDNIYYSDPDRANLYLAGGATPKNEQSIAYLLRNDLLTAVQNLQSEIEYCLDHADAAGDDNDVALYASQAADSLRHYLDLVPPRELDRARALLLEQQQQ